MIDSAEAPQEMTTESSCIHRWLVRSFRNDEGHANGECKLCGMKRTFTNGTMLQRTHAPQKR